MQINLDPRLNVFTAFGGSWENENNTTRALLIALSRSPWSPGLYRAFLDLIRRGLSPTDSSISVDVVRTCHALLSQWPDEISFKMQQGATAADFRLRPTDIGVLVELTPVTENEPEQAQPITPGDPSGIVDAWIDAAYEEDRRLSLVIESKLYGRASRQQLEKYRRGLGPERTLESHLSWEDVYCLVDTLPEGAGFDPILRDFREFMARDTRLVGFVGFRQGDGGDHQKLVEKLSRLCQRIARLNFGADGHPLFRTPEQVRGEPDFNLRLQVPSNIPGNLGIACWFDNTVSAKLVVGSKAWEFDAVRSRLRSAAVLRAIESLDQSRLQIECNVRLRTPEAVQMRGVSYVASRTWRAVDGPLVDRWGKMCDLAEHLQRRACDQSTIQQIRAFDRVYNQFGLEEAERAAASSPHTAYVDVLVTLNRAFASLEGIPPTQQVTLFSDDLLGLRVLLLALVSTS